MKQKSPNRRIAPLLMVVLGTFMLFGSVIIFMDISAQPEAEATPTEVSLQIPYPQVKRVSLVDAKAAYDLGHAIFIDTRGEPYYSQGHIPGALSITDREILSQLERFSPNDWLITYCT